MANETKHTPGPWKVDHAWNAGDHFSIICRLSMTGRDIGMVANLSHTPFLESAEANARLIAAAPELLEALQALITPDANAHIQRTKEELFRSAPEIEAKARAAISKATGN